MSRWRIRQGTHPVSTNQTPHNEADDIERAALQQSPGLLAQTEEPLAAKPQYSDRRTRHATGPRVKQRTDTSKESRVKQIHGGRYPFFLQWNAHGDPNDLRTRTVYDIANRHRRHFRVTVPMADHTMFEPPSDHLRRLFREAGLVTTQKDLARGLGQKAETGDPPASAKVGIAGLIDERPING